MNILKWGSTLVAVALAVVTVVFSPHGNASELSVGAGYGVSSNQSNATVFTADWRQPVRGHHVRLGGWYYGTEPDGSTSTITTCTPGAVDEVEGGGCKPKPPKPPVGGGQPVCTSTHSESDTNVNTALYLDYELFRFKMPPRLGSVDVAVGAVWFDTTNVTEGHSTVHAQINYRTPSPVTLTCHYASGTICGMNFTWAFGKSASGYTVKEVQ